MPLTATSIKDCYLVQGLVFDDLRGLFEVVYRDQELAALVADYQSFIGSNISSSRYGVIRGMHMQKPPYGQAKLVRCLRGKIQDVVVDVRPGSPTYLQKYSVVLSDENRHQLYVPKGCLHGFLSLDDQSLVHYLIDAPFVPESEFGVHYLDPQLGIDWMKIEGDYILSDKDKSLPELGA